MAEAEPASRSVETGQHTADRQRDLSLRVISAVVLVPLTLAVTYVGGLPFILFWAIAAFGILWEWSNLVFRRSSVRFLLPGGLSILAAVVLAAWGKPGVAALAVAVGVIVTAAIATKASRRWSAAGGIYAGSAFIAPVLLRQDIAFGLQALLFLFAVVWSTDILGYFAGRTIGGARLWAKVSPKKTWSGAIAGTLGGVAAGAATAHASLITSLWPIFAVAFVLSVFSQIGDLAESAIKRHFAAKDSSRLIPGHGGLMDRLDGFLVAALAGALIGVARQGLDAPGRGLLIW